MRCARTRGLAALAIIAALSVSACSREGEDPAEPARAPDTPAPAPKGFLFVDVAAEAGLTRVVHAGRPGKDHLLDSAGTGAAWLDYDGDGRLDAYVVDGWELVGDEVRDRGRNTLYRNRGDGTFEDVTERAGVGGAGLWGSGVAVADVDDDGLEDLLVTNFGPSLLYRNRGDGTFEEIAERAGVANAGWNTGAAFFDADGDADLDLYVAGYIECSFDEVLAAKRTLTWKGVAQVAFGPFGLDGAVDRFWLADGAGGFADATRQAGLEDRALGFGFAVRAFDYDADGDLDLYVANDSDQNYVYRNEGDGTFRDVGLWSGAALDANGAAQAGMGVAVGDADGDTVLDVFVTNFSEDFSTLYRGSERGTFRDASGATGVGRATRMALSWGAALVDLDCDGDQDLVVANGHIYPQVDDHPEFGMTYGQRNLLLENLGDGRFQDATDRAGPGFQVALSSRGLAVGDYDDDGDLDLLFTNLDAPPTLLRNDSARGHALTVDVRTAPGAGPRIGARVRVEAGGRAQVRDLASSGSYLSAHDPRLHFGLGPVDVVDRVEVTFPDGERRVVENVPADRILRVDK